jgi:hypothetical protein
MQEGIGKVVYRAGEIQIECDGNDDTENRTEKHTKFRIEGILKSRLEEKKIRREVYREQNHKDRNDNECCRWGRGKTVIKYGKTTCTRGRKGDIQSLKEAYARHKK